MKLYECPCCFAVYDVDEVGSCQDCDADYWDWPRFNWCGSPEHE
jgi:hypothetical protein